MSEERLIRQCAPTLAGIKTGSLFPCPYETREELMADVRAFNRRFAARGLCLLPLRLENGHALLYLYRPAELRRDLQNGLAREILSSAGYRCGSCEGCVTDLVRRLRGSAEFPHEIGFFFGYPAEDVFAFIREKGHNYKLVGDWKVYGDGKAALHTFRSYARCRKRLLEQASAGADIVSLLTPARTGAAI